MTVSWNTASQRWEFINDTTSEVVATIDGSGNFKCKGTIEEGETL